MKMYHIITIDGLTESGKSTLAKAFARNHSFFYMSTGDLIRINAWEIIKKGVNYANPAELADYLSGLTLAYTATETDKLAFSVNGTTLEEVRESRVREILPELLNIAKISDRFIPFLQSIRMPKPIIVDGLGVGTGIFPEAMLKYFCAAPLHVRAARKLEKDDTITLSRMLSSVRRYDEIYAARAINYVYKSEDMVLLDTHKNDISTCVDKMETHYRTVFASNHKAQ